MIRFQAVLGIVSLAIGMQADGMQQERRSLSDSTYAVRYVVGYLAKNWWSKPVYTCEKAIVIPQDLPAPEALAQSMAEKIGVHNFMRGASTSAHQCGKLCTPEKCSWSRFAQRYDLPQPSDDANKMDWDRYYRSYIDYAKDELKLNALRFSVEWALVQPNPGEWDIATLDRYADMFCYAIKRGITPVVCFHHYTDPNWFLEQGGFYDAHTSRHFVDFCVATYEHILHVVGKAPAVVAASKSINAPLWATYNTPAGYAFRGYHQYAGPPADSDCSGLDVVAQVLKNMLEAHVQVYQRMKVLHAQANTAMPTPKVGLLKNIHQIDPAKATWGQYAASPITRMLVSFADMIQNGAIYRFFTTGEYQVHIPCKVHIKHTNSQAPHSLDFIGLNYYANRHMHLTTGIKPTDPDVISDNEWYYRYPQGIYRAIVELSENIAHPLQIPLFVAENGIATTDDAKRARFYHEYLYAMNKAVQDGYPVTGYLPWTLADNYEWPTIENHKPRSFGLCAVVADNPAQLCVKEGTRATYGAFVKEMNRLEQK